VRGAFDLRHRGARAVVLKAVQRGTDWEVSGAEHCPGRLRTPSSGRGGFLERVGRDRTLSVCPERRIGVGHVSRENVVEPLRVDRQLRTAVGQRPRLQDVAHRKRRKALLKVADRLALVGSEAGDVDEPGHLLQAAGDGDHRAAVGMADEHHGSVELVDQSLQIGGVAREPAKRIRRRDHRVLVTVEEVVNRAPARSVSEGAVNENDCWLGHETSFRYGI
jgi:hypothetical protein